MKTQFEFRPGSYVEADLSSLERAFKTVWERGFKAGQAAQVPGRSYNTRGAAILERLAVSQGKSVQRLADDLLMMRPTVRDALAKLVSQGYAIKRGPLYFRAPVVTG